MSDINDWSCGKASLALSEANGIKTHVLPYMLVIWIKRSFSARPDIKHKQPGKFYFVKMYFSQNKSLAFMVTTISY
jgi:hypothetical protein